MVMIFSTKISTIMLLKFEIIYVYIYILYKKNYSKDHHDFNIT